MTLVPRGPAAGCASAAPSDIPLVVGGIVPEEDAAALREQGVARVYTPKDYDLLGDRRRHGRGRRRSAPPESAADPRHHPDRRKLGMSRVSERRTSRRRRCADEAPAHASVDAALARGARDRPTDGAAASTSIRCTASASPISPPRPRGRGAARVRAARRRRTIRSRPSAAIDLRGDGRGARAGAGRRAPRRVRLPGDAPRRDARLARAASASSRPASRRAASRRSARRSCARRGTPDSYLASRDRAR